MAGASSTQTVSAADGRTLTIAEWGYPDGFPVFLLHGTPGSRFAGQADASAYAEVGARVIIYDRPGYGGSDRFRGRRVVASVADVSAIADSLGIERFAVSGGSWGGPHSLAVAARLPERVTRAACIAGVAPFDMPGFDWFAGMDVVPGAVVAISGHAVRSKSTIDPSAVKGVHLVSRLRVEAQMQVLCGRHAIGDVHVGKASFTLALEQLRNAERSQDCLVEPDALGEVARMEVEVIDDDPGPIPLLSSHQPNLANQFRWGDRMT
jgi:pimeloyl-ACP methyl ester carboxylesterase